MRESELRAPVLAYLERTGRRGWVSPDGHDYFDIVALGADGVGLVELKVSAARQVFAQALRRRAYADWVAVAIPSVVAARRLAHRPQAPLAQRVGIWTVGRAGDIGVLRPAQPLATEGEPFRDSKARFRRLVDRLAAGTLPEGVDWAGNRGPGLAGRGRRSTRDWRLDEFA